ncbi:MAG: hypothetical protein OHK0015_51470 [Chloroflexi bacterium OHK40]
MVNAFRPHSSGLSKLFGSLESDIMELLWSRGEMSGRDVFEALRDQGQRLSYGAVKTVLNRLVQKDVLRFTQEKNQNLYRPRLSREEFTTSAVREIVTSLVDSFGEPALAQFLDQLQAADPAQLAALAARVEAAEARKRGG